MDNTSTLRGVLLMAALHRTTITYSDLGGLLGLRMDWQAERARLGLMLNDVGTYSLQEWGIALSVLAVGKKDGLPSGRQDENDLSGWYAWAEENGLDLSDPPATVLYQQAKCFAFVSKMVEQ